MELIRTINILGIEHEIKNINPAKVGLSTQALGRWIESECLILINETLPEAQQRATEWHETIHATLFAIGESELSSNEDFVEKLSRALFQMADLKIKTEKVV